jgi:hypothetical protein
MIALGKLGFFMPATRLSPLSRKTGNEANLKQEMI